MKPSTRRILPASRWDWRAQFRMRARLRSRWTKHRPFSPCWISNYDISRALRDTRGRRKPDLRLHGEPIFYDKEMPG